MVSELLLRGKGNDSFIRYSLRSFLLGFSTPFLNSPLSYMRSSQVEAASQVKALGERIKKEGLSAGLGPLVFTFTGYGNVGQGARSIFELLPVEVVAPEDLPKLHEARKKICLRETTLYACFLKPQDFIRRKKRDAEPQAPGGFCKAHYYDHPDEYDCVFHELIAPYTTVLVNG